MPPKPKSSWKPPTPGEEDHCRKPRLNLFITLGQGAYYGVGNECMNKMKEMGIANSEAYYSMEYRHGPMSLVDEHTLLVLLSNEHTEETDAPDAPDEGFGGVTAAVGPHVDQMADIDYASRPATATANCRPPR